jgi:hypothetical protein
MNGPHTRATPMKRRAVCARNRDASFMDPSTFDSRRCSIRGLEGKRLMTARSRQGDPVFASCHDRQGFPQPPSRHRARNRGGCRNQWPCMQTGTASPGVPWHLACYSSLMLVHHRSKKHQNGAPGSVTYMICSNPACARNRGVKRRVNIIAFS